MSDLPAARFERTLAAPVGSVWAMWAEAERFAQWYGPHGASIPTAEMDVQVGGRRHLCMAMDTPNGPMQMWFVGEYREVNEPNRLVYTESMSNEAGDVLSPADMGMPGDSPTSTDVIVELESSGDETVMSVTHVGIPADSPGAMGWGMALDKLEQQVATSS